MHLCDYLFRTKYTQVAKHSHVPGKVGNKYAVSCPSCTETVKELEGMKVVISANIVPVMIGFQFYIMCISCSSISFFTGP